jgi:acetyltransferase-like isoleucine patch superfamily enzyme
MPGMLRFLRVLPRSLFVGIVIYLPGEAGILLRRWYYGRKLRHCGQNFTVMPGVHIGGAEYIDVGNDVTIRENAILHAGVAPAARERREVLELGSYADRERGVIIIRDNARIAFGAIILGYGGVSIGEKCGVGPYAIILSETFHHKGKDPGRVYKYSQGADPAEQCVLRGFVEMTDGAGIASNVLVLPGATIGNNSWVAPGSVVRLGGFIDRDVIAKGDPAGAVFKRQYAASRDSEPNEPDMKQ